MRKRIITAAAVAFLALVLIGAFSQVYFIRDDASGEVLWNDGEAYIFIAFSRWGLQVSYVRYPWFAFLENSGVMDRPDLSRRCVLVIHVTSSGVEHHVLALTDRAPGPSEYTPRRGYIYANDPGVGGLCRWAGDHFVPATPEEKVEFLSVSGLSKGDFENRDGWSKHGFGVIAPDYSFAVKVSHAFSLSVRNVAMNQNGHGSLLVDLVRSGKAPEQILDRSLRREKVSRAEYDHAFTAACP
jgi:hypothetical protein